jgi:hypothetical protein
VHDLCAEADPLYTIFSLSDSDQYIYTRDDRPSDWPLLHYTLRSTHMHVWSRRLMLKA